MKQIYLLLIVVFFCITEVNAQFCPPEGYINGSGDRIIFYYEPSTEFCGNRPNEITVEGRTFEKDGNCYDTTQQYDLASGETPLSGAELDNFTVTSGFNNDCTYDSYGTLPTEDFEYLSKRLRAYPNPLKQGDKIEFGFGKRIDAKVGVYTVTGKKVLSANVNNEAIKAIDVSGLSNGLYMVKFTTDKFSVVRKVAISR
ncbi:T9SS type A sorting domain-containing protein [Snuella sedimenti]|uniref:T9SS type A sorting domain-containing protein n=1 Tax=Snuella sedimenti TaxID=2798802 RepID=A0A8J7J362_9FLAO|nr:T9SS type A sorting domain-containing protein [Snuella sedimenti]MBJ6368902.1 T9SS type A sorting domain-containing protein [Snuella sedimenti]